MGTRMARLVVCEVHGLSYDADQASCPACRTTSLGLQPAAPPASRRDTQRRPGGAADSRRSAATTRRAEAQNTVPGSRRASQLDTQRRIETQRPRSAPLARPRSVAPGTQLHGLLALGSLALVALVAYRQCWEGPSASPLLSETAEAAADGTNPAGAARDTPEPPRAADSLSAPIESATPAERVQPLIRYRGRHGQVPEVCAVSWLEMYGRNLPRASDEPRAAHGQTPLMVTAETGSLEALQLLLGQGLAVDARDDLNHTALMYAARSGRTLHVQALLRAGADARTRGLWDAQGGSQNALDAALLASHGETATRIQEEVLQNFLTLEGADLAALDEAGETPLHWAARYAGVSGVRPLLERGADLEAQTCPARPGDERGPHEEDPRSATPLLLAVWSENPAVARLLLESRANAKAVDQRGRGVFHLMRHASLLALTPDFVSAGVDPLQPDRDGKTALDLLAASGLRAELLQALAAAGHPLASPPATLEDLFGVLRRLGAERGGTDPEPAAVIALLERDALLLDESDAQGRTALFEAAAQGFRRITETLVNRGARVDARDRAGRTPLHGARDANTVQLLVRLGAEVNARDADGRTPLALCAATPGSLAAVSALVEAGANARLLDKGRRSALQLARASGSPDVVAYLETQL